MDFGGLPEVYYEHLKSAQDSNDTLNAARFNANQFQPLYQHEPVQIQHSQFKPMHTPFSTSQSTSHCNHNHQCQFRADMSSSCCYPNPHHHGHCQYHHQNSNVQCGVHCSHSLHNSNHSLHHQSQHIPYSQITSNAPITKHSETNSFALSS